MSAVMAIVALDFSVGSPAFKETERRLNAWGRAARQYAQALGLPTSSGIARMIEHVKVHEQLRRGVKPLKRSKLIKANPNADAVAVSLEIRHSEKEPMAKKESFSMRLSKVQWDAAVIQVEDAVKRLAKDAQKAIYRSYRFGQCDRDASIELRMPIEKYQDWRESAVQRVAEVLAGQGAFRYIR